MNDAYNGFEKYQLILLLTIALFITACSSSATNHIETRPENEIASSLSPATLPAETLVPTEIDLDPGDFGISVAVIKACTDGIKTTLHIRTWLDAGSWELSAFEFVPIGRTYYETAINFFEHGQIFTAVSSGKRDDPIFHAQNQLASVDQTFDFPKAATLNGIYKLAARVTMLELPPDYVPPLPIPFLEPGIIEIPNEFELPVVVSICK